MCSVHNTERVALLE